MAEANSYYELLGVQPDASLSDIRDAYKRNAAKYHPDVNDAPDAHVMMTMLNEAWETLRDPDRRKRYDHTIPNTPRYQRQRSDEEWAEQQIREEARRPEIGRATPERSNRRRIVTIAVVVAFVGAWQFLSHRAGESQRTQGTVAQTTSASTFECVPAGTNLDQPVPLELSEAQYKDLLNSYKAPVILGLRAALDAYVKGASSEDVTKLLSGTSREILSKRFTLLAVSKGVFGGDFLIVQFENEPSRIYKAWMFRGPGGSYELRGWDVADCNARQQHWIQSTYGSVTTRILRDLTAS